MDQIEELKELNEIEGIKDILMELLKTQRLILGRVEHLSRAVERLEERLAKGSQLRGSND